MRGEFMKLEHFLFIAVIFFILTTTFFFMRPHHKVQTTFSNSRDIVTTAQAISSTTEMVYNYVHDDENIETTSELAPNFLIGLTENDLKTKFPDWIIEEFSNERVTLQKKVDGKSSQHYVLGIKDGFIAVFYKESINGTILKELTDTPIDSLTEEDLSRLQAGIEVSGEDKLIKLLQDFES